MGIQVADQYQKLLEDLRSVVGVEQTFIGSFAERWSRDWTRAFTALPFAVVRPGCREEVASILRLANEHQCPVVPISGNTGLNGGAYAAGSILLSLERMNCIREIRTDTRLAVVEAGVIVDALDAEAEKRGLTFPLAFGASGSAMIGGVLSTNAGGANVLRYGNARDLCLGLEVVLPDGRILDLMTPLRKDNSGLDLRNLMIGAEGQLGVITAAIMKLYPRPTVHATALVGMNILASAPILLNRLQDASGGAVVAFEFMSCSFVESYARLAPTAPKFFDSIAPATLLIELGLEGGDDVKDVLEAVLGDAIEKDIISDALIAQSETQRREMWALRESAAELSFQKHPVIDTDIAVPLDRVADYLETIPLLMAEIDHGFSDIAVAHLGDGNIHYTVWPSVADTSVNAALRAAIDQLAMDMNGTFSAEHGVGLCKLPSMIRHKGDVALDIMRKIKNALDPNGILNPGKTLP